MRTAPLHIIANPGARGATRLAAILDATHACGLDPVVHRPDSRDAAARLAAALADAGRDGTIVAAGGDGTLHTILNGLLGTGAGEDLPAVAVWPLGTANVTARELGIVGPTPAALAQMITDGVRLPVTVGRMECDGEARWFIQMTSAGFDAAVVAQVPAGMKRVLGAASYVICGVTALPGYRAPRQTVTVDGEVYHGQQVIVANGRLYGGGFVVAPSADLAAPSFEVCILPGQQRRAVAAAGLRLIAGRYYRGVTTVRGTEITITADRPCPVQADGEAIGTTPLTCTAVSGRLRLALPPGRREARSAV